MGTKNNKKKNPHSNFFADLNKNQHLIPPPLIVKPLTKNQEAMYAAYEQGQHLLIHGYPGTGKTLLSLYLALNEVLNTSNVSTRDNVIIIRSVVPSRDMGFLPGSAKDKAKVYESPYVDICTELFGKPNAYEYLKQQKVVTFATTSFLRGLTFKNSIVYLDEVQNLADGEIHTLMTRIGENCRLIISGDVKQSDLQRDIEKDGFKHFMNIAARIPAFTRIEFGEHDILRSSLVKEYIIARERYFEELYNGSDDRSTTQSNSG